MAAPERFLVTDDCGRLARWLRLMGCDVAVADRRPPAEIYQQAHNEGRVVVTRNGRLRGGALVRVVSMREERLEEQLGRLMREAGLTLDEARLFSRCDRCNVALEPVEKSRVAGRVPPYVFQTQEEFVECSLCHRIYWAATHCDRITSRLKRLLEHLA